MFAQACLGLERLADGIGALDRARGLWGGRNHWSESRVELPLPRPRLLAWDGGLTNSV